MLVVVVVVVVLVLVLVLVVVLVVVCCCCTGIRLCNLVHALNMPRNHKHGRKTTQAARNCIPA